MYYANEALEIKLETAIERKLPADEPKSHFGSIFDSGGPNPNPFNLNFPVRVWISATERILSILLLHWKYRNWIYIYDIN